MSDVAWASAAVQTAFPCELGSKKQRRGKALDFLTEWPMNRGINGWPTARRVRALWNQEVRQVIAHEKEALEAALEAKANEETRTLLASLQSVRQTMQAQDPDFHSEQISAFLVAERSLRAAAGMDAEMEE